MRIEREQVDLARFGDVVEAALTAFRLDHGYAVRMARMAVGITRSRERGKPGHRSDRAS